LSDGPPARAPGATKIHLGAPAGDPSLYPEHDRRGPPEHAPPPLSPPPGRVACCRLVPRDVIDRGHRPITTVVPGRSAPPASEPRPHRGVGSSRAPLRARSRLPSSFSLTAPSANTRGGTSGTGGPKYGGPVEKSPTLDRRADAVVRFPVLRENVVGRDRIRPRKSAAQSTRHGFRAPHERLCGVAPPSLSLPAEKGR